MIEEALRRQLRPVVNRRRHVDLARRLSVYWAAAGIAGVGLIGADWLFGWRSALAVAVLCIGAIAATVLAVYRSRRIQPDYRAIARAIEQRHPDLKALLLAAVEQEPTGPDGQLGYLQRRVIKEALAHAVDHRWQQSISTKQLALANVWRVAAFLQRPHRRPPRPCRLSACP